MGIFNKKKNNNEENVEKDLKLQVLEKLNEKIEGTLYDNAILFPRFGFSIDIQVGELKQVENIQIFQLIFIVKHDDLDEPIIEPISAQGETLEKAIIFGIENFYAALWLPIKMMCEKQKPIHVESNFLLQHYDYDMFAQSVVIMGNPNKKPAMLVNFIKDVIPRYLGSKKYYWVRISLMRQKDKKTIEVRVNGTICPTLNEFFKNYIDSWEDSDSLVIEKQYAMFMQREDDKCPFTKSHVVDCTRKAIELLENCKSPEEYAQIRTELEELAGDPALAAEIRVFVPEILAKIVLKFREGDSLFLLTDAVNDEGEPVQNNVEFKKSQLRSYYYIQQVVLDYLSRTKPEQDKVMNIVANSVAFRETKKMVEQGHKPEDLYVPGISYKISVDNYKVW